MYNLNKMTVDHSPDNIEHNIANALRAADLELYRKARYPFIQEGESVYLSNEDFTGVDLSLISLGFFEFFRCTLDKSVGYSGQPVSIFSCSAQNIDLRDTATMLHAVNSDFTGMRYNGETSLEGSIFIDCKLDKATERALSKQGVKFLRV